jgi:hypothetical protein
MVVEPAVGDFINRERVRSLGVMTHAKSDEVHLQLAVDEYHLEDYAELVSRLGNVDLEAVWELRPVMSSASQGFKCERGMPLGS